jgi:2-dehydro-3-deoxygluconokinase
MFELEGAAQVIDRAQDAALLYFSLISLAILPPPGREQLLSVAHRVRESGGQIAFDGNYRPRLWRNVTEARRCRDAAIAACDIGLPSFDDEKELSGFRSAAAIADHWQSLGAAEVVVKMGNDGAFVEGASIAPPSFLKPVDTSGAGDAFNAAYLASRRNGADPRDAALFGHLLAGWVVMRPGAIPPTDETAPYRHGGN